MNSNRNILSKFISGTRDAEDRLQAVLPVSDEVTELLVAVNPGDYAASAIAKAVEDCDVQLLALAVTAMYAPDGRPVALLRIAAANGDAVERSFARYGYEVIHARPSQDESPEFQRAVDRANELLHLLEL